MKPKPPLSTVPNPTTKPSSNRSQRAVKIPVKKQNGETSKSKKEKLKDDLSVLMKSISTSVTSLQEIIKLFKNATPEIIDLITNECSIILECKICKNLFRSLANFMTHKRGFCLGKFEELFKYHEHSDHIWYAKCRKNKTLSSRSTTRKDILALIESMKGSVEQEAPEATVLQDLDTTNEGLFNLRYFAQSLQDPSKDEERQVTINPEESPVDEDDFDDSSANDSCTCNFCPNEFPSLKALNSHVKKNHGGLRLSYGCPCCKKFFANTWSIHRHLYKVHRKTSEQVRKLRNQITKKYVSPAELERSKRGRSSSHIDEKDQEKAFMEDLKGHGSLQRCPDCGKRFERKVALIAHSSHCNLKDGPGQMMRSLKRKALTPLKEGNEKKPKYSPQEIYLRERALEHDVRVLLSKADMIPLKEEKMDDYETVYSPSREEDISSFVQAYQGDDEIPCKQSEYEDLLNKIHMEVNTFESVPLADSDQEENEEDDIIDSPEGAEKPDSQDDVSGILEGNDYNSQEDGDSENENEDDTQRNNEGGSDSDGGESSIIEDIVIISDEEFEDDVTQDNEEEQRDPLELDDQDNMVQVLDTSNEQDVIEEEVVVDGNIVIQDFINDNSYILIDDNIIDDSESSKKSEDKNTIVIESHTLDESAEDNCLVGINSEAHEEPLSLELGNDVITIIPHRTEVTDTVEEVEEVSRHSENGDESEEFEGFSDIEFNSNHISQQHLSITNNRNKIMLKEFDELSLCKKNNHSQAASTSFANNFLQESSFDGLTKGVSQDFDSLSMRYDLVDANYIVAKEIVLFNDSDGVCISNMSNSGVLEESLKHSISPTLNDQGSTKRYFSKLNGGSPSHQSMSPQIIEIEDDGDSLLDGSDWVTKKINSLINGQKKKCLLCLKTFHKVVFVRRHVASHFNINKFKCLVNSCNFKSFLRADMNGHLIKVHKKKELDNFVERLYPRKEDFDDSLYNPEPKPLHSFEKNYKSISCDRLNVIEVPDNETKYPNSIILGEESLDGLNICEEMELPCLEESPTKLLRYEALDDDTGLPPLQDQDPVPMKALVLDVLFGNKPDLQGSTPTES